MTLKEKIDEIIEKAVHDWNKIEGLTPRDFAKSAIHQALEVVLSAEPSEGMIEQAETATIKEAWPIGLKERLRIVHRAMSAQLIKELK